MANAVLYPRFENKPFATLGDLLIDRENLEAARVKNDMGRQSVVESQARVQEAQQQAQDKATTAQRAEAQRALAQEAFQKFGRPDGSVDQKAIIAYVQPKDYDLAQKLSTSFAKFQKDATDARKGELDNEDKQWSLIGQALQGVNASTYAPVWSRINSLDPEMGQFLGPQYDPQKVQTALAMGTARSEWNKQTKEVLESDKDNVTKALNLLANSADAEHAADAMEFAKVHGVDDDLTQMGFGQWAPDTPQRAANFLIGPEGVQRLQMGKDAAAAAAANTAADNARASAAAAEAARHNRVTEGQGAQRIAQAGAAGADGQKVKLSAGQQQDLETMLTVSDMAKAVRKLGDETNWAGTGGMWTGSLSNFGTKLTGKGDPRNISLRNQVGNIKATIAKLRGGTAFTPNEQALLESYTPTIDDSDVVLKQKLTDLETYIETKRKNMLKIASGDLSANTSPAETSGRTPPPKNPKMGDTWQSPTGPTKWNGTTWGPA